MSNGLELEKELNKYGGIPEKDLQNRVMSILYSEFREVKSKEGKDISEEDLLPEHMGFSRNQLETMSLRDFTYGSELVKKTVFISDYNFLKIGNKYMMAVLVQDSFHVDCNKDINLIGNNLKKSESVGEFFRNQLMEGSLLTEPVFQESKHAGIDENLDQTKIIYRNTPFNIDISDPVDIHNIDTMAPLVGKEVITI